MKAKILKDIILYKMRPDQSIVGNEYPIIKQDRKYVWCKVKGYIELVRFDRDEIKIIK